MTQSFSTAKHCHIYHQPQANQAKTYPNSTHYAMPLQNGLMNLEAIITHLGQLGYHDVWVEAGGAIFSALHSKGLVHRTYLYLVPGSLGIKRFQLINNRGFLKKLIR
ncbi:dihydrofolate reductase family protein [Legionella pneumophila]|nr:dihydrofolate reductase family protein [Legionella pneumophila]